MVKKTAWLERRFESGLPVSLFPNVLERLRGTPARLEERVRGVPASILTARSGESWSINENIGHLLMAETLWKARIVDFEARHPEMRAARYEPQRVTRAGFNDRPIDGLCAEFRHARTDLVSQLDQLDAGVLEVGARHPRLDQTMRVVDLMVFIAEHDDHHLARITELIEGRR